jgi:hypothetical protein
MKVTQYDLKAWVEKNDASLTTFNVPSIAMLVCDDLAIIVESDGCHEILQMGDNYEILMAGKTQEGDTKYSVFPDKAVNVKVRAIIEHCPKREDIELTEFVRKFGTRIEVNYATLLRSIKEIGLDPNDYTRK